MRLLKQSTAFTFRIGPFLDDTDGKTAETGLSIGQADIQISKNGGAFAQTSASPTTTHDADGWYQCPLTTTDTGTLGPLTVQIVMSGALPVWEHFMVVPANVYDSIISGSDYLQTDAVQIEGTDATDQLDSHDGNPPTAAAIRAEIDSNSTQLAAIVEDTGTTLPGTLSTIAGYIDTEVGAIKTVTDAIPDGGALTTIAGNITSILGDTNELQTDLTNGGRLDLILDELTSQGDTNEGKLDTISGYLDTEIAAILEDTGTTLPAAISAVKDDTAAILIDTAELQTDLTNGGRLDLILDELTSQGDTNETKLDTIAGYVDTEVAAILEDTGTTIPGLISALNNISAADVWDSASATLSLSFEVMLDRIYRFLMNKMNITDASGAVALRNEADSGNVATQSITDDDTTTTRTALTWS